MSSSTRGIPVGGAVQLELAFRERHDLVLRVPVGIRKPYLVQDHAAAREVAVQKILQREKRGPEERQIASWRPVDREQHVSRRLFDSAEPRKTWWA